MVGVKSAPNVSVIILCWNSGAYLPRCLGSLAAQTYDDFEVIIVDNGSTDGATDGLETKYPGLNLHVERLESNRGFASGNNVGARRARGSWLALLNADAFPEPDWLEQLLKAAASHPNAFFASRQVQANRPSLLDGEGDVYHVSGLAWRRNYNYRVSPPGPALEVFSACAAAAMIPRKEFLEVGGFDEDYLAYQEDVDLGFRLRLGGMKCILVPGALVRHVGYGSSSRRSDFATYYGHRNLVWTYAKDMPWQWFWLYLPLHLLMNVISLIYFMFAGKGRVIWRAKWDAFRGLPIALRKRRLVQARRRVSLSALPRAMNRNLLGPLEGWFKRHYPAID
jgi:GT2 family glycosyltransferase